MINHMADGSRPGLTVCGRKVDNLDIVFTEDETECKKCIFKLSNEIREHHVGVMITLDELDFIMRDKGDKTKSQYCGDAVRQYIKMRRIERK